LITGFEEDTVAGITDRNRAGNNKTPSFGSPEPASDLELSKSRVMDDTGMQP
jgi:hypothetical protein